MNRDVAAHADNLLFCLGRAVQESDIRCAGDNSNKTCAGCLVVITDHGPRAEAAQALGHELLVDNGEGRLEGLEEERQKKEEEEVGEEREKQTRHKTHNAQMTMHVWSDARWTT